MFHYTDFDTLKKIVETRSLLATHVGYVNDTTEVTHACRIVASHLNRWRGELPRASKERQDREYPLIESALALLDSMETQPPPVFVACFSKARDDLSQWRGYTSPGAGICMQVSRARLHSIAAAQDFSLEDCEYLHEAGTLAGTAARLHGYFLQPRNDAIAIELRPIAQLAAVAKNLHFRSEAECRLIHYATTQAKVEDVGGIPRVRFDLSMDPELTIETVSVCPSPNDETTPGRVEQYLRSNGIGAQVTPSTIPYRPRSIASRTSTVSAPPHRAP